MNITGRVTKIPDNLKISKSEDCLAILKKTWAGDVYRGYLKHVPFVRKLSNWLWRHGYPIYVNQVSSRFIFRKNQQWRPLTKFHNYVVRNKVKTFKLVDSEVFEAPMPGVFPVCDDFLLMQRHEKYSFPDISVAVINNAITYGGTNLILVKEEVICHDLYNFETDYTSEEMHGLTLVDSKRMRIRWLWRDQSPMRIVKAASFVDACAPNYAHWLSEVLPRIVLFCAQKKFNNIPIVVNDGLHGNIMQSLFQVVGEVREVIVLRAGRALSVENLYLTSVAGYVPFEPRNNKLADISHGLFSSHTVKTVSYLLQHHLSGVNASDGLPEKVFVRRNSKVRSLVNSKEVETLLISQGYVIIEPEKLTFAQQVKVFSNAKVIVSPTGAACANIIFCSNLTRIVILIPRHKNTSYWYWPNLAYAAGNKVNYVLGQIVGDNKGIHSNYIIEIDDVLAATEV